VTKRVRLIWKTLIFCSLPVAVFAAVFIMKQRAEDAPYVAGMEQEGITRSLERSLEESSGLRFTEVTEEAGLRFHHFPFYRTSQLPEDMGSGVAWGDYDADGLPDLFLVNFAAPVGTSDEEMASSSAIDRLFRNLGDGTFEDVTETAGVGTAHRGMGAAWGDYDNDGDLDLFVTSWGENILWENQGDGTFHDVTSRAGLLGEEFWAGASWQDYDLDGDLDLYVCGYVHYKPEEPGSALTMLGEADFPFTLNPSSYPPIANRFYVNKGDGTFEDRAEAAGVLGEKGRSLNAAWADFDADGFPDLYISNDVSDNNLFHNRGDGTFEDASYRALVADYRGSMGIAIGDWDGDLDLDLFVTHWMAQENALYTNMMDELEDDTPTGGLVFGDDADQVGLGQIALDLIGWGTVLADFDNDGWLDLYIVNGSTFQKREDPRLLREMDPHLYWNQGVKKGFFEVGEEAGIRTVPPGSGRGLAAADYDMDGDLDLVVLRFGAEVRLLRNDSGKGHWTAMRTEATSGHASGLGARIVIHAGDRSFLREVGAGASYLSQSDPEVLVGLGDATRIDSLEVTWPLGAREVWTDLAVDRRWMLMEGKKPRLIEGVAMVAEGDDSDPGGRRTSDVHKHAVVADLTSALTREEKLRFWELNKKAVDYFNDGEWALAVELLEQMNELDPTHEDALYYRGNCLLELGRYEEAVLSWKQLVQLNPKSSRAWVQMGILHTMPEAESLYDLETAVTAFSNAHDINREESRPLVLWGEAALANSDLDEAEKVLTTAHRMNPQDTSALYLCAYIAWKRGERVLADSMLVQAVDSMKEIKPIRGVLGEGDTRSVRMVEVRRAAAGRRLFAECLESLRQAEKPVNPDLAFSWLDESRGRLP
jgi:Flp pilus assembly protein TadD